MDISVPTIHLNGTAGDQLYAEAVDAADTLRVAIRRMQDAAPNARDYYVQGDLAYGKARKEHELRIERLTAVREELEEIANGILAQRQVREAQQRR